MTVRGEREATAPSRTLEVARCFLEPLRFQVLYQEWKSQILQHNPNRRGSLKEESSIQPPSLKKHISTQLSSPDRQTTTQILCGYAPYQVMIWIASSNLRNIYNSGKLMTEAAREHERVLVRARYRRRREQILHKLSDSRRFMTKADHTRGLRC